MRITLWDADATPFPGEVEMPTFRSQLPGTMVGLVSNFAHLIGVMIVRNNCREFKFFGRIASIVPDRCERATIGKWCNQLSAETRVYPTPCLSQNISQWCFSFMKSGRIGDLHDLQPGGGSLSKLVSIMGRPKIPVFDTKFSFEKLSTIPKGFCGIKFTLKKPKWT
jgi:hypothetical protein